MSRPVARFVLAACAVALCAEAGARVVLHEADPAELRWHDHVAELKVSQMDSIDAADVVIVGTSMAQQDLVPSVLAAELADAIVYNAGLNGGIPVVTERWLLDHVTEELEPNLVVWGLSALDLSSSYGGAVQLAYEGAPATAPGWLADLDRTISGASELVRSRRVLRNPSSLAGDEAEARDFLRVVASLSTGEDGERRVFDVEPNPTRQAEVAGRITPFDLDRDDIAAILRTAEALRERGVRLVLVELPTPRRFQALYPLGPEQHQVVNDTLAAIADHLDVPLITLAETEELGRDPGPQRDSEFVDFTHLSEAGAARYSEQVAEALAKAFDN